jgi:hypothetical protein
VQQDPAADASCQWSHQLIVQEQSGLNVQLTRLLANGADWTAQLPQLFGTDQLPAFGALQAQICWTQPPPEVTYEIDGLDQTGSPVSTTVTTSFAGAASDDASFRFGTSERHSFPPYRWNR